MEKVRLTNARKMRLAAGLTVQEVSEKMNLSRNFIYMVENGESTPGISKLIALAKLYNCEIKDLL